MQNLFLSLLEVSAGVAVLMAFLLCVMPLLSKVYRQKWRYWVWLLIAVRLLIPWHITLPSPAISVPIPQEMTVQRPVYVQRPQELIQAPPVTKPTPDIIPLPSEPDVDQTEVTETPAPPVTDQIAVTKPVRTVTLLEVLGYVWLTVTVGFALFHLFGYLRFLNRSKRFNRPPDDPKLTAVLDEVKTEMGIVKPVRFYRNALVNTPLMVGFLKPCILLPTAPLTPDDCRMVLRHELLHYKRRDVWYKLLMVAVRCVHWFNPLVWVLFNRAENDLEIACDEDVLRDKNTVFRQDYCETILRVIRSQNGQKPLLSTAFCTKRRVMQRRFRCALDENPKHIGTFALVLLCLAIAICGTLIGCELMEQTPSENASSETTSSESELWQPQNAATIQTLIEQIQSGRYTYDNAAVTWYDSRNYTGITFDYGDGERVRVDFDMSTYAHKAYADNTRAILLLSRHAYSGDDFDKASEKEFYLQISEDHAKTWTYITLRGTMVTAEKIVFTDQNTGYIVWRTTDNSKRVSVTHDGGYTWQETDPVQLFVDNKPVYIWDTIVPVGDALYTCGELRNERAVLFVKRQNAAWEQVLFDQNDPAIELEPREGCLRGDEQTMVYRLWEDPGKFVYYVTENGGIDWYRYAYEDGSTQSPVVVQPYSFEDSITRQVIEQAIWFHEPLTVSELDTARIDDYCEKKLSEHIKIRADDFYRLSKETADAYVTAHFAVEPFVWDVPPTAKDYDPIEEDAYNFGKNYDNPYGAPWIECEVVDLVLTDTEATVTLNVFKEAISVDEHPDRIEQVGTFVYHGNLVNIWEDTTTFQLVSVEQIADAAPVLGVDITAQEPAYDAQGNLHFACTVTNSGKLPLTFWENQLSSLYVVGTDFECITPEVTLASGESQTVDITVPAAYLSADTPTYVRIFPTATNGSEHTRFATFTP